MLTEKTARKREEAVLNAMKPYFEKYGRGIDYLLEANKRHFELSNKENELIKQKIELVEEIRVAEQQKNYQEVKTLQSQLKSIEDKISKIVTKISERLFSMGIKCSNCGAFMSQVQIVCHKCGNISANFPYDVENAENIGGCCYNKIQPLAEQIKASDEPFIPYKEVEKQIKSISKIKKIAETYIEEDNSEITKVCFNEIKDECEMFLKQAADKKIEIAVVGKVKSGKSTLINALLGQRMASVDCTPETAVLVKYKTTKDKNYIKISFYKDDEWQTIWDSVKSNTAFIERFNELNAQNVKEKYVGKSQIIKEFADINSLNQEVLHWTSSAYPEYYFVDEVEVGFCGNQFPIDVILVDTPGLSDIVKYRSDITKHYLKHANYVLACVRYETINQKEEAEFLEAVLANLQHNSRRMLIVGTQADKENKEEDAKKKQELFFKNIAPLYDNKEGVLRNHFVSVQAEPYLLLQEYISGKAIDEMLLQIALFKMHMNISDVSNSIETIERKFGITVLKDNLEKNVYYKTREQIIQLIKDDYNRINQNIRSIASGCLANCQDELLMIENKSEEHYEEKNRIEENLNTLFESRFQIAQLVKKISSNIDKKGD